MEEVVPAVGVCGKFSILRRTVLSDKNRSRHRKTIWFPQTLVPLHYSQQILPPSTVLDALVLTQKASPVRLSWVRDNKTDQLRSPGLLKQLDAKAKPPLTLARSFTHGAAKPKRTVLSEKEETVGPTRLERK